MSWASGRQVRVSSPGSGGTIVAGVFTADTGGVTANDVVYVSGANLLKPVASATQAVAGVALNTAAQGAAVDLLVIGLAALTAGAAISAGDNLGPSATAGRAISLNTYTPAGTNAAPVASGLCIATCNQNHPNLSAVAFTGTAANTGLTFGRALTAAGGAGSTFTAFVNCGGGR